MSVAGITSTPLSNPTSVSNSGVGPIFITQRRADALQLSHALQNGDLAGAQSAFATLSALGDNNSGPFKNPRLAQDFSLVGQALQSGDLAGAQTAFAKLQQDIQTTINNHHSHPHIGPGPEASGAGPG